MVTTVATFYPDGTGQADWDGTDPATGDFRKLLDVVPATQDTTTITAFGTAIAEIVCRPYLTNTVLIGSDDPTKWGWAVNLLGADGMGSTATAQRFVPAGNWTFQGRLGTFGPVTSNYGVTCRVYRVSAAGARSLLFAVSSTPGAAVAAANNWSAGSLQPQYTLAAGETLVVSYSINKSTTSVLAENVGLTTGVLALFNTNLITIPSPGVRTLNIDANRSAAGVGVTAFVKLPNKQLTAAGVGTSTIIKQILLPKAAIAVDAVAEVKKIIPLAKAATAIGLIGVTKQVNLTKSAVALDVAAEIKKIILTPKAAVATGIAGFSKLIVAFRVFAATAVGVPGFGRAVIAARTFAAVAVGVVKTLVQFSTTVLNRIVGGGGSIVRRILMIFDD